MSGTKACVFAPENVPSKLLVSGFMTWPDEVKISPLLNLMRAPFASDVVELTVTPDASIVSVWRPLDTPVPYSFEAEAE